MRRADWSVPSLPLSSQPKFEPGVVYQACTSASTPAPVHVCAAEASETAVEALMVLENVPPALVHVCEE